MPEVRTRWHIAAIVALGASASAEFAAYSAATLAAPDRAPWDASLPAHIVPSGHHWPLGFSAGMLANAVVQTLLLLFLSDPERAPRRPRLVLAAACCVGAVLAVEALRASYLTSNDAFAYVGYAQLSSNAAAYDPPGTPLPAPFAVISDIWRRPLLPAAYGPLDLALYRAALHGQATLAGALLAVRAVGVGAVALLACLVFALTRRAALVPVVVLNSGLFEQTVVNGHNDLIAADLVLLGTWIAARSAPAGVAVGAASGLIKANFAAISGAFVPARAALAARAAAYAASLALVLAASALFGGGRYAGALGAVASVYGIVHRSFEDALGIASHLSLAAFALAALAFAALDLPGPWTFAWSFFGLGLSVYVNYLVWGLPYALREAGAARWFLALLPIPSLTCDFLFRGSGELTRIVFLAVMTAEAWRLWRARRREVRAARE